MFSKDFKTLTIPANTAARPPICTASFSISPMLRFEIQSTNLAVAFLIESQICVPVPALLRSRLKKLEIA